MQNILIIGFNTRNIVCSARRAGYNVYSIDAFRDLDLQKCAYGSVLFEFRNAKKLHQFDFSRIKVKMDSFDVKFDAIVLGSGMEMIDCNSFSCSVLASSIDTVQKASDKLYLSKRLDALGISHPHCYSPEELDTIECPVIIKPAFGGGGVLNRIAKSKQEIRSILNEFFGLDPELPDKTVIIQDFLEGVPSSVSLLSTKNEALSIALNEQLIGISWLSRLPFAYCGNITPFRTEQTEEIEALAEELVLRFKLQGSNGVDFLITENGPVVLEINPRFQGSLDTVEKVMDINLFEAHVDCFRGKLPEKPNAKCFAARGIFYSDRELFIDRELMNIIIKERCSDIPPQGTIVKPDWPITSLFSYTSTRGDVVLSLERGAKRLGTLIEDHTKSRLEAMNDIFGRM